MPSRKWLVVGVVAVAVAGGCGPQGGDTGPQPSSGASDTAASRTASIGEHRRQEALFYLRGTKIRRLTLESNRDALIADLHTKDVFGGGRSPWVAYIAPGTRSSETDVDFVESPVLHLFNVTTRKDVVVGPGLGPVWGPGAALAYLRPVERRDCSGERCSGRTKLVLRNATSGAEVVALSAGHWRVLGWLGHKVLVGDADHLGTTLLVDANGGVAKLALSPSSIWAGAPNGRWLLTVDDSSAHFLSLGTDGAVTGSASVSLEAGILAEGSWSLDSTSVAAGLLNRRTLDSKLVVLGPDSQRFRRIGSVHPAGSVLWSRSGSSLVAVATDGSQGLRAVRCITGESSGCSTLLRWKQGVALLSLR